jgi:electron transfer flavoprotein-quinone oxidoreductase
LSLYDRKVAESFIRKDLKKYQGLHGLLNEVDPKLLFSDLPRAINTAAFEMLSVDGKTKAEKQRFAIDHIKSTAGGTWDLIKLGWKGWRAING